MEVMQKENWEYGDYIIIYLQNLTPNDASNHWLEVVSFEGAANMKIYNGAILRIEGGNIPQALILESSQ